MSNIGWDQRNARKGWYRTLRERGLTQATGRMTDGTGFCCLGVAEYYFGFPIVVDPTRGPIIHDERSTMSIETAFRLGFLSVNPILWEIPDWLEDRIAEYEIDMIGEEFIERNEVALSFLNDKLRLSFAQIADVCEAQPDGWTGVPQDVEMEMTP